MSQESTSTAERSPEHEAIKHTERMLHEFKLTTDQVKLIYDINLRFARARRESNTRAEALQRSKDKEVEILKVLTPVQRAQYQNKRYERSTFQFKHQLVPPVGSSANK